MQSFRKSKRGLENLGLEPQIFRENRGGDPSHPTRQKTGASQKMDRSKKGPPEVPHREGALGTSGGPFFEGVLGRELPFLRGFWGTCGGVARGLAGDL